MKTIHKKILLATLMAISSVFVFAAGDAETKMTFCNFSNDDLRFVNTKTYQASTDSKIINLPSGACQKINYTMERSSSYFDSTDDVISFTEDTQNPSKASFNIRLIQEITSINNKVVMDIRELNLANHNNIIGISYPTAWKHNPFGSNTLGDGGSLIFYSKP